MSRADGFGWYANIVNHDFYTKLMNGGLNEDMAGIRKHFDEQLKIDKLNDNQPENILSALDMLERLANRGIKFHKSAYTYHQWYPLSVIISAPGFSQLQYKKSGITSIGDSYVSPKGVNNLLEFKKYKLSKLYVFSAYEEELTRYKNGSCINNIAFGKCIYNYIFISKDEVEIIYDELRTDWMRLNNLDELQKIEIDNLYSIFSKAYTDKKPLIFYGQD